MWIQTCINSFIHYITVHCIASHRITLHYITLHCIALHYITLHYITLHYITWHAYTHKDICVYIYIYIYIYTHTIYTNIDYGRWCRWFLARPWPQLPIIMLLTLFGLCALLQGERFSKQNSLASCQEQHLSCPSGQITEGIWGYVISFQADGTRIQLRLGVETDSGQHCQHVLMPK